MNLFCVQRNCLRLIGHSLSFNKSKASKWKFFQQNIILLVMTSAQGPMIYYAAYHISELSLATASLSIIFTNMLTVLKMSTFLVKRGQFLQTMKDFEEISEKLQGDYARELIVKANKTAERLGLVYLFSAACTGLYFMIMPLLKTVWAKLTNKDAVRELPMPMRFPFDSGATPGYEFAFAYTGFITVCVVMNATAIDGLFLSFAIHLRGHFQCLQHYIQSNSFQKSEEETLVDIRSFVQYHKLLLSLSDRVRRMYKPVIFGQFFLTSLQVCTIIYQLVIHMGSFLYILVYITFLSSIMIQLFIYCYGGEIIKSGSLLVGISTQLSNWYTLSPKNRRMLCLIIQRSQREIIIKAGIYEASLADFMTILKAAGSYMALIQSIE